MQPDVVIKGVHGTRLPKGRRKVYDGVIYEDPFFEEILSFKSLTVDEARPLVKGLYYKKPELIFAKPEQILFEAGVQFAGSKALCAVAGITKTQLRKMLELLMSKVPLYAISRAISEMRQHDQDLADDPKTAKQIAKWRRDHPIDDLGGVRTASRIKGLWTNHANNALNQIDQANKYKAEHPTILRRAPKLSLCKKTSNGCETIDRQMVRDLFPDVK